MKRLLPVVLVALLSPTVCPGADPPKPSPVILPPAPAPPVPPPPTTTKLPSGSLYVVRAEVALTVLCSPDGAVTIGSDTGPIKIKGIFVGGSGKSETVTFKEKYVYTVEAAKTGPCELIIVPAGSDIVRVPLDVEAGPAPPTPGPPTPPGPTDPLTKALQDAYAADADPAKVTNLPLLAGILPKIVANGKATGKLVNVSDLQDYARGYVDTVLGAGALPSVRKAASAYVATKMPATDGPLTDAVYVAATAAYADVAKALSNVKGGK